MRFQKITKDTSSSRIIKPKGRYRNARGNWTNHERKSEKPVTFVGVDGEGMNVYAVNTAGECVKEHRYVLFGVGDAQIENPNGLTWESVFSFLYSQYKPGTAYVGFYLGYDFTQIIKTLPEDRAHFLLTTEGIAARKHKIGGKLPHPVVAKRWHLDLLANKRLRIRPKECSCLEATCKCKHKPWMYICDVGSFFQQSFLKVIDPGEWPEGQAIVTDKEYQTVLEGKQRRSTAYLDDDMRKYNRLENVLLSRAMETLDRGFHDIGIHLSPSKWFGPGQAAQAWLRNISAPTAEEIREKVPPWFLEAARMSYFGGWFEIMMHGIIPGVSHEYDINSAYPSIIASLPCLLHGNYTHGEGIPSSEHDGLCLVYARVWSPGMPNENRTPHVGTMLHRDGHGRILRPCATEGWFWWHELKAAERAGLIKPLNNRGKQRIMKWVKYRPCGCPPPMAPIAGLYMKRLEVGKSSPLGKAAKLVYNSGYGKFAQSVGEPLFANSVYASLITSGCRTQILDAIATHPKGAQDVAMVATDGIYFLTPHPGLKVSNALGEWDYTPRTNLTLFKPGVYWDDNTRIRIAAGQSASFKARGINAADFASQLENVDAVFESWRTNDKSPVSLPTVEFKTAFTMTTALQALRRGKWELAGAVEEGKLVVQDSNPRDKRWGLYRDEYDGREIFRSKPYFGLSHTSNDDSMGLEWIPSYPYERRFGMEDPFSDEYRTQFGETPDGTVHDVLSWMLKGE